MQHRNFCFRTLNLFHYQAIFSNSWRKRFTSKQGGIILNISRRMEQNFLGIYASSLFCFSLDLSFDLSNAYTPINFKIWFLPLFTLFNTIPLRPKKQITYLQKLLNIIDIELIIEQISMLQWKNIFKYYNILYFVSSTF